MYDVIVELLYCYKCVLLFVIKKVNLFSLVIAILEIIAVVNALQLKATRATPVLSRLFMTGCLC